MKIIQVGLSGFPKGTAAVSRCLMLNNLAIKSNYSVLWLNNKSSFPRTDNKSILSCGQLDGIEYIYTSGSAYIQDNFFFRRLSRAMGLIVESFKLINIGLTTNDHLLLLYPSGSFLQFIRYRLISLLTSTPLIVHYVEYRTSHSSRKRYDLRINDHLFDNLIHRLANGFIPISIYLEKELLATGVKSKRIFRIPSIVDFNIFTHIPQKKSKKDGKYFLFCGGLGYQDSISLIIQSFKKITNNTGYRLVLIVSGSQKQKSKLVEDISLNNLNDTVDIYSNLDYKTLLFKYSNAIALLVPLRNILQDIARFPQKIAEYTGSGNPIITHQVGDIPVYFRDGKSALIADNFDANSYSLLMQFVIENPQKAKQIGLEGKKIGAQYFDSNSYTDSYNYFLKQFLRS